MKHLILGLTLLMSSAASASAKDCAGLQTQTDLTLCEGKNLEEADARLN